MTTTFVLRGRHGDSAPRAIIQQFLHDVHHAYLLLHGAMSPLPPTMIPNIEPMPLPSTGAWDQPEGFLPLQEYSEETNAFIEAV